MIRLAPRIFLRDPAATPGVEVPVPGALVLDVLPRAGPFVFGDGSHPTTRLCAAALYTLSRERTPASVLDVGTGTGILARIARALGAARVVGTDVDPAALASAAAHAALDEGAVALELGDRPPDAWGGCFELIVANILEEALADLAPALSRALAPGGRLLLSGFTPLQAPRLRLTFEGQGLTHRATAQAQGWALMDLVAPSGFSGPEG